MYQSLLGTALAVCHLRHEQWAADVLQLLPHCSSDFIGGLLLAGANIGMGLFATNPCWGRPSPPAWVPQGKTWAPNLPLSVMEALREKIKVKPYGSAQISIQVIAE